MNVLVSINRGYKRHFFVMLHSLIKSCEGAHRVFVMHDDLTKEDEREIRDNFPLVSFAFLEMDAQTFKGFPTVKRYPQTIYYRIFAPLLLPKDVDRILYLDSDLIVHASLKTLYNADFEGNLFIACTHIGGFLKLFNCIRMGVKFSNVYMNTGVLLMNVAALREVLDKDEICRFTIKNKWRLMLYDQDILYKFYGNRVKEVSSLEYNLSDRQLSHRNRFKTKRNKIDKEWVEKNNKIVHYIGVNKPWKKGYKGILANYYLDFARSFDSDKGGAD